MIKELFNLLFNGNVDQRIGVIIWIVAFITFLVLVVLTTLGAFSRLKSSKEQDLEKGDKPMDLRSPEKLGTCEIEFWAGEIEEDTIVVLRHPSHVEAMEWLDVNLEPGRYAKETLVDEDGLVIIDDMTNKPVILYFYKSPENSVIPNWIGVGTTLEAVKAFYKEREAKEMEKNVYKVTTTFFLRENDTSKESIEERIQSWGVLSVLGKASEIHSSVEAIHKNCCPTAIDFDDVPTEM